MIKPIPFYDMYTGEYLALASRFEDIITEYAPIGADIQNVKSELTEAKQWLNKHFVKPSVKNLTTKIKALDKRRNNAFIALRDYLKACNRREDEGWHEASELLLDLIKAYGTRLYRKDYQVKSVQIPRMIDEMENDEKFKPAVALLNVSEWLEPLKNAQAEFDREQEERTEFKSNIPKSEAQQACRKIESTCKLLFKFLEVMTEIESTDELTMIIKQINVVIQELTTTIHIRKGKKRGGEGT